MGQMSRLETTVRNYHYTLRNIPEERRYRSSTNIIIGKVACVPIHHATNVLTGGRRMLHHQATWH